MRQRTPQHSNGSGAV
uniref:Uncharacterized protein n=1 Tax=Arundo donax TaxID=35708 RepID=A0A0A8YG11_ARUDO